MGPWNWRERVEVIMCIAAGTFLGGFGAILAALIAWFGMMV